MNRTYTDSMSMKSRVAFVILLSAFLLLPLSLHAQESTDSLSATIRAELASDPRTASLSQAQLDAMVSVLTQEAQKHGLTSNDIRWHPRQNTFAEEQGAGSSCASGFLCTLTNAFGFAGVDPTIPFFLGLASMGLIWVLAEMLHRRRHPAYRAR